MLTLKKRADFVGLTTTGAYLSCPYLVIQIKKIEADGLPAVGFTASKKVGNAVARNFAKRRLRALARRVQPQVLPAGCPYLMVLVAKKAILDVPFPTLESTFLELHARLMAQAQGV